MASVNKIQMLDSLALTGASNIGASIELDQNAAEFLGVVAVSAIGAATTATVKIQHSADALTWFDLISFTALTAVGSEAKAPTVPVMRYVRSNVALAGGPQTATIKLQLAHKG